MVKPQGEIRVLVADHTPEARTVLRRLIESDHRFRVVAEAATGLEAVEQLDAARPDAVVLDIAMPDMGGLEMIPVLMQRAPLVRILVLSSMQSRDAAEEVKRRGAHDYLEKGSGVGALLTKLQNLFPELGPPPDASPETAARVNIDDVMSLLVHELQAPLTVVEGLSIALSSAVERGDDATIFETSEAIRRAMGTLRALIRSFAEVGAMEAGRLTLNLREAQVPQLVKLTVDDLSAGAGFHTLTVDDTDDFAAQLDTVRVRRVITNLIANAMKFSPHHTEITIRVRKEDERFSIGVTDEGPGIPLERQRELFQKFSRLGATGSGTGLGLYLSRGIALAHNGDLVCDSRPGQGATFTLWLPLKQETSARA
ncbi:MAG: ATP-binding protein [Actinomycetota bacterium]